jgi:hypothetical protein
MQKGCFLFSFSFPCFLFFLLSFVLIPIFPFLLFSPLTSQGYGQTTYRVQSIRIDNVIDVNAFNSLVRSQVLSNTSDGDAETVIKGAVCDVDVGAVGLEGDAIVTIDNGPAVKGNKRGVNCVDAVRVG